MSWTSVRLPRSDEARLRFALDGSSASALRDRRLPESLSVGPWYQSTCSISTSDGLQREMGTS
jgi:hypothetical protein